jgi:hypothetical protein
MSEFDPWKPAMVHDQLNDKVFEWEPERYLMHYRKYARPSFDSDKGLVEWDGLLLDGWMERPRGKPKTAST